MASIWAVGALLTLHFTLGKSPRNLPLNATFTPKALGLDAETRTLAVIEQCLDAREIKQFVYTSEAAGFGTPKNKLGDVIADARIRTDTGITIRMNDFANLLVRRLHPFLSSIDRYFQSEVNLFFSPDLRFAKYRVGGTFGAHRDTPLVWSWKNHTVSELTLLVYLNNVAEGGETRLMNVDTWTKIKIEPGKGRCLIFSHDIMHSALPVRRGIKRTSRTDVLVEDRIANLPPGCLD
ncbi:hypothetical protein DFJ77DRAFT_513900 [Powellomyces hirtus]|nr:hypothetical protein DFJ77DRAFT_513900 [Powellomyces hirtus]